MSDEQKVPRVSDMMSGKVNSSGTVPPDPVASPESYTAMPAREDTTADADTLFSTDSAHLPSAAPAIEPEKTKASVPPKTKPTAVRFILKTVFFAVLLLSGIFVLRQTAGAFVSAVFFISLFLLFAVMLRNVIIFLFSDDKKPISPLFFVVYTMITGILLVYGLFWAFFTSARVGYRTNVDEMEKTRLDSQVVMTFSKPVYRNTLTDNLVFQPDLEVKYTWQKILFWQLPFATRVTLTPATPFDPGTEYIVTLSETKDLFGRKLKTDEIKFTTSGSSPAPVVPVADELAVRSVTPADGAENIPVTTELTVIFSQAVDPDSFAYIIKPAVESTVTWNSSATEVIVKPSAELDTMTSYTVTIQEIATTADKKTLAEDYLFTFTTGPEVQIVDSSPKDGSTDVQLNSDIRIVFNQKISSEAIRAHFSISPTIEGQFAFRNKMLTFTPVENLAPSTRYTVTLTKGLTGEIGAPLLSDYIFSFSTGTEAGEKGDGSDEDDTDTDGDSEKKNEDKQTDEPDKAIPTTGPTIINEQGWTELIDTEDELMSMINAKRAEMQVPALVFTEQLKDASQAYCLDLALHGYYGNHVDSSGATTTDRLSRYNVLYGDFSELLYAHTEFDSTAVKDVWLKNEPDLLAAEYTQANLCVLHKDGGNFIAVLLIVTPAE
ncbi:MAG TPA: Ig-like domain-containing protein [bacterium]|nr:Ig-like domain-containing protein [bacterium]